ncbi:MAG: hypothetical protein RR651_05430 [Lysinibacillus sp.]
MKKVLFILLLGLFVAGAGVMIYLKSNPPLEIKGYTSFDDNENVRLIEIENKGLRELQLQNIIVNDGQPEKAELIVSRAEQLESGVANDPNITSHGIKQVKLFPSKYIDRKAIGKQPQHYGLKVEAADIQTITIYYEYLKMSYILTAELKTDK